jgi:hypothetical protein
MAVIDIANLFSPSPRRAAAPTPSRVSPRVYTPYPVRRLTRPMAVRAESEAASVVSGRTRLPFFRRRGAAS